MAATAEAGTYGAEGDHWWLLRITPEAGTVKDNVAARDVVLHLHLIEQGFPEFGPGSEAATSHSMHDHKDTCSSAHQGRPLLRGPWLE